MTLISQLGWANGTAVTQELTRYAAHSIIPPFLLETAGFGERAFLRCHSSHVLSIRNGIGGNIAFCLYNNVCRTYHTDGTYFKSSLFM
jgi:hypothetical protein